MGYFSRGPVLPVPMRGFLRRVFFLVLPGFFFLMRAFFLGM